MQSHTLSYVAPLSEYHKALGESDALVLGSFGYLSFKDLPDQSISSDFQSGPGSDLSQENSGLWTVCSNVANYIKLSGFSSKSSSDLREKGQLTGNLESQ